MVAIEIEKHLAEENKVGRPTKDAEKDGNISVNAGESRAQAAVIVGTNSHYVTDAKKIAAKAPELKEAVLAGRLSIPDAKAIAQFPEEIRVQVIEEANGHAQGDPSKIKQAIKDARETERQKRATAQEAEHFRLANTPEARAKKDRAQKEKHEHFVEENRQRKERQDTHATRIKAQLNAPERAKLRTDFYVAAKEADMLLTRGLKAYFTFLQNFTSVLEGLTIEEDIVYETPREGEGRPPWEWMSDEGMSRIQGWSKWLKRQVDENFNGSFEELLAQCASDRRLNREAGIPYIDFIALQKWIDDPSEEVNEADL